MQGHMSTGFALNLAWTIYELCRPIKTQDGGGVDPLYLLHPNSSVVVGQNLIEESTMGDADRIKQIKSDTISNFQKSNFKTQIFWLGVNATHVLLCPSLKEATCYGQVQGTFYHQKKMDLMADAWGDLLHSFRV